MYNPNQSSDFSRNLDRFQGKFENPYGPELGDMPQNEMTQADMENVNKTGTTIVGMVTQDGVVMASDQRASLGGRVVSNKNVQKVEEIQPNAAITISGSVGGAQSFIRSLRAEANLYEARRGEYMNIPALSTIASNLLRGGPFFVVVPILAGVDDDGGHVFSLDPSGSSMEDKYTAQGSGMPYALGTLENEFEDGMTTDEAVTVGAKAINAATERDTASGNGIHITKITRENVEISAYEDVDELL
ncbi:archaeal proteasome endopeptidase complex subunit beta [Halocalculus aciditolerans]|uniref:Proteasome subunit beta n=1 Tax=Halocalculus aciditolerans TaxID=1383812 RepID=A0A830FIU9_9EURY|nr:archaeal proteasome endopeptidase complex subunit beta [Halocalculus aciditolerans]GGL59314.1 proteasome subunit beta [Halocalculus aciditolerans]